MVHSLARLDNLPDEILMIILKNLDNDEVLYSLMGVNKRLNSFVRDSIFTSDLTLMKRSVDDSISPLPEIILSQFYSKILREIYYKIQSLDVESSSMERILSEYYPNLHRLGLYDTQIKTLTELLTSKIFYFLRRNQKDNKNFDHIHFSIYLIE
jgi:hypothetical protein